MDQESVPFWCEDVKLERFSPLKKNQKCDVCIVGSGISGLTCAYALCKSGKNVIVVDDGPVAGGQTMRTTAHLATALDDHYFELEKLFGEEGAKLAHESHRCAIDFIENLVKEKRIECDFRRVKAYLFNDPNDNSEILEKEKVAAKKAGLDVKMVVRAPFRDFDTGKALCFDHQAEFHPLKYIHGLTQAVLEMGGQIFCGTHVSKFGKNLLTTEEGIEIEASHTVVATNSPVNHRFFPHLKQSAYRTYVIGAKISPSTLERALYYDTLDPYHYIRVATNKKGETLLIAGGEDHRTGEERHPEVCYSKLEAWLRHRFPTCGEVLWRWSGQVMEPVDSLAFIGKISKNKEVYLLTGDSGNGLTHGTLGGILIHDLIMKKSNPWEKIYNPHRKSLKATKEFVEENLNTAAQYKDWFTKGEEEVLRPHSGCVVRRGLKKCALYRDEHGKIHEMSAICPHLGGIVHWNESEHCWECPAHGSRFDASGHVIQGPANTHLKAKSK